MLQNVPHFRIFALVFLPRFSGAGTILTSEYYARAPQKINIVFYNARIMTTRTGMSPIDCIDLWPRYAMQQQIYCPVVVQTMGLFPYT